MRRRFGTRILRCAWKLHCIQCLIPPRREHIGWRSGCKVLARLRIGQRKHSSTNHDGRAEFNAKPQRFSLYSAAVCGEQPQSLFIAYFADEVRRWVYRVSEWSGDRATQLAGNASMEFASHGFASEYKPARVRRYRRNQRAESVPDRDEHPRNPGAEFHRERQ